MKTNIFEKPMTIEPNGSVLILRQHPDSEKALKDVQPFLSATEQGETFSQFRLVNSAVWNGQASLGLTGESILKILSKHCTDINPVSRARILNWSRSFGLFEMKDKNDDYFYLKTKKPIQMKIFTTEKKAAEFWGKKISETKRKIPMEYRGQVKKILTDLGYPALDSIKINEGEFLDIRLRNTLRDGKEFELRPYQEEAKEAFFSSRCQGNEGVIICPAGSGKTVIGVACMAELKKRTLIIASGVEAMEQWRNEILRFTYVSINNIGFYQGTHKALGPITITTYQTLGYREGKTFPHLDKFRKMQWGLIIWDEVHKSPADTYRLTAQLQSFRRLGLTATPVREDGREEDIFTLIGPQVYNPYVLDLVKQKYIAKSACQTVNVPLSDEDMDRYLEATGWERNEIMFNNPNKIDVVLDLVQKHQEKPILIISTFLDPLNAIHNRIPDAKLVTGNTSKIDRLKLYDQFRNGEFKILILSSVGDCAINLPDAEIIIQVAGRFGSRNEHGQRLGRVLRPKSNGNKAIFYSIVSADTMEVAWAEKREDYLMNEGFTILPAITVS